MVDQTVVAAFHNRETAELALKFVLERSRIVPKRQVVVAPGCEACDGVPIDFETEVREYLVKGQAALILQVDETAAFRALSWRKKRAACGR